MSHTGKFDEHRKAAFLEDVKFLREGGLSDAQIAQRLGVHIETLEKREARADGNH